MKSGKAASPKTVPTANSPFNLYTRIPFQLELADLVPTRWTPVVRTSFEQSIEYGPNMARTLVKNRSYTIKSKSGWDLNCTTCAV